MLGEGPKEAMGSGYDQDILCKCMKLSKNKLEYPLKNVVSTPASQ